MSKENIPNYKTVPYCHTCKYWSEIIDDSIDPEFYSICELYDCEIEDYYICDSFKKVKEILEMNKENKLCPFCRSDDLYESVPWPFYIGCRNCSAEGPVADTIDKAWEKWNKRNDDNE